MLSCLVFQCYISSSDYTTTQILLCTTKQLHPKTIENCVWQNYTGVQKFSVATTNYINVDTFNSPAKRPVLAFDQKVFGQFLYIEQTTKFLSRIRAFEAFIDIIKTATVKVLCMCNYSVR